MNFYDFALLSGGVSALACGAWGALYYASYNVRSQILGRTDWRGSAGTNSVALTFDDGPSDDTEAALDVLRSYGARATFFMLGREVEKRPRVARRIVAEGHEIGNHSYSHPVYLFCAPQRTRRELQRAQKIIMDVTGVLPKFSRPPCGVRTPAYFRAARELGLRTVMWTNAGFDWQKKNGEEIARLILKDVAAGSIVLLHDGDSQLKRDRKATVAALPLIIEGLEKRNLRVAPLSELLRAENVSEADLKATSSSDLAVCARRDNFASQFETRGGEVS